MCRLTGEESAKEHNRNSSPSDVAVNLATCAGAVETTPAREEHRTTIMIKNIPNSKKRHDLVQLLDQKNCRHDLRLVYLPFDFTRKKATCKGYAYVDMQNSEAALKLMDNLRGHAWGGNSEKIIAVDWATKTQGYQSIVDLYKESPINSPEVLQEYKPAIFDNGEQKEFPTADEEVSTPSGLAKRKTKQSNAATILGVQNTDNRTMANRDDVKNTTIDQNRTAILSHQSSSLIGIYQNITTTRNPQNNQPIQGLTLTLYQEDIGIEVNHTKKRIPKPGLPLKIYVYGQGQLPMKNGFIHFDVTEGDLVVEKRVYPGTW